MGIVNIEKYDGDLMTVEEFEDSVDCGLFIDYDGFGHWCNAETNQLEDEIDVYPSDVGTLSYKAQRVQWSHILWFNR
jgi:hypothetical protein